MTEIVLIIAFLIVVSPFFGVAALVKILRKKQPPKLK